MLPECIEVRSVQKIRHNEDVLHRVDITLSAELISNEWERIETSVLIDLTDAGSSKQDALAQEAVCRTHRLLTQARALVRKTASDTHPE